MTIMTRSEHGSLAAGRTGTVSDTREAGSAAGGSRGACKIGRALIAQKVEKKRFFLIIAPSIGPAALTVSAIMLDPHDDNDPIGTWFGSGR